MPIRGKELWVTFPMIASNNRPVRATGVTWQFGDVRLYLDGVYNYTSDPVEIGSTGRYRLYLSTLYTRYGCIHLSVVKPGYDLFDMDITTTEHPVGTVVANGGNTSSTFKTNLTSATTDFWKNALVSFVSGSLAGQVRPITGYNGSTKFISVTTPFTATPASTSQFILVGY